jgi:hypothetical protein
MFHLKRASGAAATVETSSRLAAMQSLDYRRAVAIERRRGTIWRVDIRDDTLAEESTPVGAAHID